MIISKVIKTLAISLILVINISCLYRSVKEENMLEETKMISKNERLSEYIETKITDSSSELGSPIIEDSSSPVYSESESVTMPLTPLVTMTPTKQPSPNANPALTSEKSPAPIPTINNETPIPLNKSGEVGIWYSVWYAKKDPETLGYTTENKNPQYNTWIAWDIPYIPLGPNGIFETHDSLDEEVINYHLKVMSEADIDFIIMDQTNYIDVENRYINFGAMAMAKKIKVWNDNPSNKAISYS